MKVKVVQEAVASWASAESLVEAGAWSSCCVHTEQVRFWSQDLEPGLVYWHVSFEPHFIPGRLVVLSLLYAQDNGLKERKVCLKVI